MTDDFFLLCSIVLETLLAISALGQPGGLGLLT